MTTLWLLMPTQAPHMRFDLRSSFRDARMDAAYAARTLLRTGSFLVAVLSLGLAVGATTAVYATADWLLSRSPGGVVEPERLVGLWLTERGRMEEVQFGFSYPQYRELEHVQDAFVDVSAYAKVTRIVGTDEWSDEVVTQFVTGSYFPLLGLRPYLGRLVGPEDDLDGAAPLAVLSHSFWRSHFGGDPDVIGASFRLGVDEARVIGVLPADYEDYSLDWNGPTQLWLPMRSAQGLAGMAGMLTMNQTFFRIMGRLVPGVDRSQAGERAQRWVAGLPPIAKSVFEPNAIGIEPESQMRVARREQATAFLGTLLLVSILVLLAACFNVANLLVGRAALRRKEMAIRAALGASWTRMVRQVLTEASLLALAVGAASAGLGVWVASLLAPLPQVYLGLPYRSDLLTTSGAVDPKMVGLAVVLAFVVSLGLGVLPMLGTFRSPIAAMKSTTPRWSWSRHRPSPRQGVLVLQVGLALVLAVTAGFFARSFDRAANVDLEYASPESVLMASLVPVGLDRDEVAPFYRSLMDQLGGMPGVVSATLSSNPPFAGGIAAVSLPEDPEGSFELGAAGASPRFFETNGIEILAGREFTWDQADAESAIINDVLAQRLWPGADPLGRVIHVGGAPKTIIGLVRRERCRDVLDGPSPCIWSQTNLGSSGGRTVRIRTVGPPNDFVPTLRKTVHALNPNVAILEEQVLGDFLGRFVRAERTSAILSSALALFGIVLLAIGCASLFASMVRDGIREIAIRTALGATRARLIMMVTTQGLLLLLAGSALGLIVARMVVVRIASQLYGISPSDPTTYVGGLIVVVAVSLASVLYPTIQATKADPGRHLQME